MQHTGSPCRNNLQVAEDREWAAYPKHALDASPSTNAQMMARYWCKTKE